MPHTPHLAALATARLGWQLSRPLMALASALLLMFTLSGCSGCSDEGEGCDSVVCLEGGVCSESSGQCVNPEVCGDVACLPGYSCGVDNTCVADTPCSADEACERGVCQSGACVNRDSCTTQADCVAPNTCDTASGVCVNDPCQDGSISCERGVCSTSAGACVNEVVCTQATEQTACLAGNICVNQACVDEATFCGQLGCERGVCSPAARACVSAPNCGGEDARCVAGEFCAPDNTCQPNVCDANMTDCPRGVCEVATGQCVNPPSCEATQDCVDDNVCLSGQCTPRDQACGEAGCPGNQLCVIDATSAACQEDEGQGCESALDCTGDRICAQGACADAPACPAEDVPNNTPETATSFQQAAPTGSLTASLCQGDVDFYSFDTRLHTPALGELVIDLGVLPQDLGLGSPTLELHSPQGSLLSSATAGADGRARVQAPVALLSQGVYRITVRAGADVRAPGVRYALTAGVFASTTLTACQNAQALTEGEDAQGSTISGASNGLRVACGLDQTGSAENIWRFTLTERSFVQLTLTPAEATPALAFTIRADCLASLPDDACGVAPTTPTLERALEAGSYLVVVQGASADGGGEYTLRYTSAPAICSGADNRCQDANTALSCNAQGTGFDALSCDNGCDTLTARCNRSLGDICSLPLPLQGSQQDIEINWQRLSPAFDPGADGCVPVRGGVSATAGPDRAVQVSVGPGQALLAALSASDADTALYLVEDCDDSANTCLVGVNAAAGAEQLVWYNDGEQARQLSLIADIASVSDATQPSTLSVEVKDAVCAPSSDSCGTNGSGDDISQSCDATGDSYTSTTICNFGCDTTTGLCEPPPNDTCDGAIALTSGVAVMGDLALYSRDYTLGSGPQCSSVSISREALYSITLNVGDVLDVSMTALSPTLNPVLRVVEGCDMNQLGACMRSANETSAGSGESVRFRATRAGEYIIIAAASNASSTDGWAYGLSATVTPQQCVPGSPSTCNAINLEYCDSFGLNNTTSCSGGCANGACVNPRGDTCADPILMTGPSGSHTGTFASGTNEYEAGGLFGTCYLGSVRNTGKDIFYRIDLQAGELATFSLNASGFNGALFLTENCYDPQDCIDNLRSSDQTTLQYYAYGDSTVYVVVDNTSTASDSSSYTLNWTVNNTSVCAPNSSRCIDDNTAGLCDASGTNETSVPCMGGCERGACAPDVQANDVCATVASGQPVGDGVSLYIDNIRDFTNTINLPAATSCAAGKSTGGPDLFYKMALEPGELLRASARGYGSINPIIYVITDCADAANSCLIGADEGTSALLGAYELAALTYTNTTLTPQEVIVGFDSNSLGASGPLQLLLSKEQGPCIPGQATCNEQGTGLLVCNEAQELVSFPCDGACTGNTCDTPAGDLCQDAIALQTQSGTITDSWAGGTNTFTLPVGASGGCYITSSTFIGNGREDFYKIDLLAGDSLSVSLSGSSSSAMLVLLEDCAGPDSCLKNNPTRGATTLHYYAQQSRTLYIAVDNSTASATTAYTLTWEVTQGLTCSPGAKACIDDTTASICAADGLSETQYTCTDGCSFGACNIDVAVRDTCANIAGGLEDVGQGISVVVDYSQLTNNVSMTTTGSCVDGKSSAGRDASFRMVLAPGEIAVANVQGLTGSNPVIYAITDCGNPAGTCLAGGGEVGSTEFASFQYANTTGAEQAIIVVVDSSLTSTTGLGPALVEIEVQQPECMFGEIQCAPDNATLLICNAQRLFDSYSCNGACTNDQCDAPRGDECFDPIRLTSATGSVTGSWSGGTNSFAPSSGTYGACLIPTAPAARERFHAIDLQAGELLSLSLDTTITTALLFILEDCSGPDTCLANTPLSGGAQRLTYLAEQAQRVLILADSTATGATASYTLSWTVTQGAVCNPNATRCVDGTTVAVCDVVGSAEALYSCPEGCQGSACIAEPVARNVCADVAMAATDIGQGVSVYANYADFTANISMPTAGSCVDGKASTGRDFFYKVRLDAGEVLRASAQGLSANNPVIYAITDCADAANTCVAGGGEVGSSSEFASLLYANTTGAEQTLIVGVDSSSAQPSGFVQVNISVEQPQCTPGQTLCDASGTNLQVCNASSLYDLFPCQGGCTATTCDTPAGDFCADAIPLSGMSGQVTGSWASGTNNFAPTQGLTGQCYLHSASHSPVATETFYRIDLQANDVLNASISSSVSNAQLFILEDCVNPSACVMNGIEPGNTALSYHTQQARTVYLVADNSSATATASFTVSWEIRSGLTCAPSQARCLDADTAALCSRDGSSEQTITCANGCSYRGCVPTPAERNTCAIAAAAATDIGQGISDFAILSSYTNDTDVTISTSSCIADTANGNDLFYKVTLAPDEIVYASIQTFSGSSNPSIYAITDCADAANTCVKGRSEVGSTEFASFLYANETGSTQTLIIGADTRSNTSSANAVHVIIEKLTPTCSPGTVQCDAQGVALLSCDEYGLESRYSCEGGCSAGACVTPRGDVCVDALPLAGPSGSVTGSLPNRTNSFSEQGGLTGQCYVPTGNNADNFGLETFYQIDLQAGEELHVSYEGSTNGHMYLLEDCFFSDACVNSATNGGSLALRYYAQQATSLVIVIDSNSTSSSTNYTLSWEVVTGSACIANASRCVDTFTAATCAANGQSEAQVSCVNGCFAGGCVEPVAARDSCSDVLAAPQDIGDGFNAFITYGDYTNSLGFTSTNSCAGAATPGRDMFYKVTLAPGELVDASVRGFSNSNPAVYVITDCSASAASCLAGNSQSGTSSEARVTYANTTGASQTVLVGVDSTSSASATKTSALNGPALVTIKRTAPECTPATTQCGANGRDIVYCDGDGIGRTFTCPEGCNNGACVNPSGDFCADAIPLNPGGAMMSQSYTDSVIDLRSSGLTNTIRFPSDAEGCITNKTATGEERIYAVTLLPGQSLDATLLAPPAPNGTLGTDVMLYVLSDCLNPLSCLAPNSDDAGGHGVTETVQYTNSTASSQTVFLVADSYINNANGAFNLTVNIL